MKKIFGILGLLIFLCLITGLLNSDVFLTDFNLRNLVRRVSLFSILSIGVTFVIITGGIDLSIGSVVALVACLLPWVLVNEKMSVTSAVIAVMAISLAIGLFHGLLITKLNLQPFVVTLCGLLIYRGLARGATRDQTQGFGNVYKPLRYLASGSPFAFHWFIVTVGGFVTVWALLPRGRRERMIARPVLLLIGALLIAIGTAPLWWRFHFDVPSIDPDAFAALWFWRRGIIEFKAAEPSDVPSLLLYWIGLGSLVVGALWLIIISLWSSRKTLLPLLVGFIACIAAVFICRSAIRAWPAALEAGLQIPKLLLVLRLSLGLALAATALWWFISRALKLTGPSLRSPLFLLVSGGIMCLIGFTPLPRVLLPMPFLIMLALGIAAAVFLNQTI